MTETHLLRRHWQLHPEIDFLNHGSFGACPTVVLQAQRAWQDLLELEPIRFLAPERELEPKLDVVRHAISQLIHAPAHDVAFVRNATDGVNAVLRSFPFERDDEILITDHGYNACNNVAHYAARQSQANVKVAAIPFPIANEADVVLAIEKALTPKMRLLLIDHVTSYSGMVLPLEQIIEVAHRNGTRVLVDGAHAPGMIPLDLEALRLDYYTANHHKWLCGPKVSGFLYVHPQWQAEVRPTVISHAANRDRPQRTKFIAEFDWAGTFDPSPLLAMTTAIELLESLLPTGYAGYLAANHSLALKARQLLCSGLQIDPPTPDSMIGSLVTVPLHPSSKAFAAGDRLQPYLYQKHRIEVPCFAGPENRNRYIRVSCQAYNDLAQYERLAAALEQIESDASVSV
jgi:isopenicillin-N epimerase